MVNGELSTGAAPAWTSCREQLLEAEVQFGGAELEVLLLLEDVLEELELLVVLLELVVAPPPPCPRFGKTNSRARAPPTKMTTTTAMTPKTTPALGKGSKKHPDFFWSAPSPTMAFNQ